MVEYRILGPVAAVDHGHDVDLGGLRERVLLARLLLSAGRVVPADTLAHDLWSGEPPPHSAATLRVYVSRLRRALGDAAQALITQPPGYRLAVEQDQLDATRFTTLVQAALADLASGRAQAAAAGLRQALGLWQGEPLADMADLPFARAEVARLEEARLTAVESRVEADLACGRHVELAAELDGLVADHPLRERLAGQRMLALYRCGRQAQALAAHEELRERLADELGIDPSPQLQRLQLSILRQDPELDWHRADGDSESAGQPGVGTAAGPAPRGEGRAAGQPAPKATAAPASHEAVLEPAGAGPGRPGFRLPAQTTSFIGREGELATIDELLGLSRLVTLTGPSGSGKSRLALRVAEQVGRRHADGACLVELAPVIQPDLVVFAVARALSVAEVPGEPLAEAVVAAMRDREALLVLDNCEHLLDPVAELTSALLQACPRLRILATSQSKLNVPGEATWPIPPLTLPAATADADSTAGSESVRLFCDRARLARPLFALTPSNAADVRDICRRLDGIPLAIELAAARVGALTTRQLASRLDDRFRVLTGGSRAGLPRHRTLEAAIEWSYELLTPTERVCLRRLAAFSGGCTIEAAEAACSDDELPVDLVFETVATLIDRSLLTTEERAGSMRYGMLESIRHYAARRLDESGERAAVEHRAWDWLRQVVSEADLEGPDQVAWLEVLEAEQGNVRAALDLALNQSHGGQGSPDLAFALELAGAMAPYWAARGPVALGRRWIEAALDRAAPSRPAPSRPAPGGPAPAGDDADLRSRAIALDGAAMLASVEADHDAAQRYLIESLAIWRELGDVPKIARCLGELGAVAHIRSDYLAAGALYAEALELAQQAGYTQQIARCLSGLGRIALHGNDLAGAEAYYEQSMAVFESIGDVRRTTLVLGNLGVVAIHVGDLALARQRLEAHLRNAQLLGDRKLIGGALTNLGMVCYDSGDFDRAAELHRQALRMAEDHGDRRLEQVALINLGLVAVATGDYAEARALHRRALALAATVGEPRAIAESIEELAQAEAAAGNPGRAAVLIGASQALRAAIDSPIPQSDLGRFDAAKASAVAALGADRFGELSESGSLLSIAEILEFAQSDQRP
ncbi:MAG TPA: BTAD domain-containing putative transcriptional regulator [Streptosporangiaceae bacterium]|nr:BTAD domain-containing putative transcriptional regulator [Streptosporangiaceae bacterium]